MDKVSVSVVIPAYNSEAFIAEAIRSVHAQTRPVEEIIVVDDGSQDKTAEISKSLGAVVISQSHRGISAARNAGISAARNEWIAFLDADDLWLPEKIERQSEAISLYPDVGLLTCHLVQWREGIDQQATAREGLPQKTSAETVSYHARPQGSFLADTMNYNSPTMLIRRDLLISAGMFDERVHFVEGVECYLRLMARCAVAIVNRVLVKERLHDGNLSLNHIEMSLAWIRMLDAIQATPEKYPAGAGPALSRGLAEKLLPLARTLLDKGRGREARALLRRSFRERPTSRAIMLWPLTFLGPNIFGGLLTLRRRLGPTKTELF